jgi:hypothetical protein
MTEEWEVAMTIAERSSLAQQLMYSYGFNRRSIKPARLLVNACPRKIIICVNEDKVLLTIVPFAYGI